MAGLNVYDFGDSGRASPTPGFHYNPHLSEFKVVESVKNVHLLMQADSILRDLKQHFDPSLLHRDLLQLQALFQYDFVRKFLEDNQVHLYVVSVMQHLSSSLPIQQIGFQLLSEFVTESLVLRKSMTNFKFLLQVIRENMSDATIQESGMNVLQSSDDILKEVINTVTNFRDSPEILLAAVSTLCSLLKKESVRRVFVQEHLAVIMEVFEMNRHQPKIILKVLHILQEIAVHDTVAISEVLEHVVMKSLVPLLLTHTMLEEVQIFGLKLFHVTAPMLLKKYISSETASQWLKVLYNAMHIHMENPIVQTIACKCLSTILMFICDSIKWIGENTELIQDPIHIYCLIAISTYKNDPSVFTAAADAIYHLTADNDRLCKLLMEKNAHVALIVEIKHQLRNYLSYGQKDGEADVFAVALAAGCRALRGLIIFHDDHKLTVSELDEIPSLLTDILEACADKEDVQCEVISTISCLADIDTVQHLCILERVHYHVIEATRHFPGNAILLEASFEALAVLGGAANGAMILNDNGATSVILQVLKNFPANINIQKKGLMLLQILAESRLVETKELCEALTEALCCIMTRYRNMASIQREAVVAMEILAEKGHLMSEVLVEHGCHEILFEILESFDGNQGLHDLASECLYVIGCIQNLKSRMLLSACHKGYLAGAECLVEFGADINIGQGQTTPLYFAVKNKDDKMVKFLLQQEVTDLQTSLQLSLTQGTHRITGMLLFKFGQDRQGGTVLWGGYGLGDLQPEWFIPSLTLHATSKAGRHLVERLKKGGEKRKSRISHSPSDSQLEMYKHHLFRFCRSSSDCCKKSMYSQAKQEQFSPTTSRRGLGLPIRIFGGKSRQILPVQKKHFSNGKSGPDSDFPSASPPIRDIFVPKLLLTQNNGESVAGYDSDDSVFDHTLDEWEEWKQNTLTGANIPFSASDPRQRKSSTAQHHSSPKRKWLRKYSLQSSPDVQEELSSNESTWSLSQTSSETPSVYPSITLTSPRSETDAMSFSSDYRMSSPNRHESTSSDTDFDTSHDSIMSPSSMLHSQAQSLDFLITCLDVSSNHINSLDRIAGAGSSFLKHFSVLEKLDLQNNHLQSVPVGMFEHLPRLQYLSFRKNDLANFPSEVMVCQTLYYLDVSENKISDIAEDDFSSVSNSLHELCLDSNGITQFPNVLDKVMPNLEQLSLARNKLTSLEKCSLKLPELKILNLSHNAIGSIPDDFLSACSKLESLEAMNNKLKSLPDQEISKSLPRLYSLKLKINMLSEKAPFFIPKFILELPSLRTVDLSDNNLDGLPPPAMWKSQIMKHILVSRNNITKLNLNGVKSWGKVEKFHIASNKISELPKDIGHMVSLESLDINHNKTLTTLPDELGRCSKIWEMPVDGLNLDFDDSLLKGNKSDLIMYLHNRLKKAQPYYRIKLMVIGYGGRGKTTLLQALRRPKQQQKTKQTVGVIVEDWEYGRSGKSGKTVRFTVSTWDFAGQEEFYSTHQCFLSNRALYLVVYDITKGPEEIDRLRPWLSNIYLRAPGCPVIVVGTHYDQLAPKFYDEYVTQINEKLFDLMKKSGFPEIRWSTEVDCTCENHRLTNLRGTLKDIIDDYNIRGKPVMGQMRPASYIRLAELLSEEAKRLSYPVIKHARLKQIVKDERLDLEEDEELQQAVRFLHEGGILLHYNETGLMLRDFYFIDPGWLCQMMAKIVTIPRINPFITHEGIMEKESVKFLFDGKTFPLELTDQYLRLLEKFEIALPRNETQLLIPCKLPKKTSDLNVPKQEKIHRFYAMPYTPLGFWSRLITRLIVFSQSSVAETWLSLNGHPSFQYWMEGIFVLWSETAFFLIDSSISKDCEELHITVPATLPGYQLLGFLVDHLDALIDEWYPGLTTVDPLKGRELLDKYIPCVRCPGAHPYQFQFQDLLNQSDLETTDVIECPVHKGNVTLAELAPDIMLHDVEEKFWLNVDELEFSASLEYLLGDGGFGCVYRAVYKKQAVAAKVFNSIGDVHPHKLLRQEATILRRLRHPSVISLLAVGLRPCRIVILELAPLGALAHILKSENNLSKILQHRIASQIAEGLKYLHELMIVFRDLKPDNILMFSLSTTALINAKISDYGISQFTTQYGLTAQEGSVAYRAPEVIRRETYSFQADVFSFGILLYMLLTGGCHPHEELNSKSDMDRAIAENSPIRLITRRGKPPWPDMHDLIKQCMHQVPDYRPKTDQIVERLRSAELYSLINWYPISVGTTVECMTYQISKDGTMNVWVISGDNEHMQMSCLNVGNQCGALQAKVQMERRKSINLVGYSLGKGRILSILCVNSKNIVLGTQMGKVSVFNTETCEVIHSTKQLPDSVISLHLLSRKDDSLVLAGLANGVLAFYPLSELLEEPDHFPLSLNLGKDYEPIKCLVQAQNKVLASCGSRIFVINTKHGLAIEKTFDTVDDGNTKVKLPICTMAVGRHLFLSHIRSPILQVWDVHKECKLDECNIAEMFQIKGNDARITAILLHESRALWLGTGGGHMVILESATLAPLIVVSRHTSSVRGFLCINSSGRPSSLVLSGGLGFRNAPDQNKDSKDGCIALWDADFPQLVKNFKEYVKKRKELANKIASSCS